MTYNVPLFLRNTEQYPKKQNNRTLRGENPPKNAYRVEMTVPRRRHADRTSVCPVSLLQILKRRI